MRDFWKDVAWIASAVLAGAIVSCAVTVLVGVI
jgi:hypothetical protein